MKKPAFTSGKRAQIEKSKSTTLAIIIIASIVISFSIVITKFLWDLGQHYGDVAQHKEQTRDTLNQNLANAQPLKDQFATFENADDGITSQLVLDALPSKYDFPALVTSLDALAKRSGMSVTSITGEDLGDDAQTESSAPTPIAIPVTLTVQGQYDDFTKFVSNLNKSIRPFNVTSIEIRGSDQQITAEMEIETYYQPSVNLEVVTQQLNPGQTETSND